VPLLGDIPFIGRLFKSTTVSREKQETLIFITPRILADSLVD
jgi:type IV pilus assembly protein PilQ